VLKKVLFILLSGLFAFLLVAPPAAFRSAAQSLAPLDYDIVYVRAPRPGGNVNTFWPDAITPLMPEPGADLMLLHPNGTEEVLFSAGGDGTVIDPYISYDARSAVFSFFHNARNVNPQRGVNGENALSYDGADIYRIDLVTRSVTRLTFQEFTPNTGNGADFDCSRPFTNCPRVGVFNTGPAFLPNGRIVFTSTRDNFVPNKMTNGGQRAMQLWVMDGDGKNTQPIGFLNVSSAIHPFVLRDGRVVFTSWENMGARDDRVFPLWAIWPDGTRFEPFSGFGDGPFAHHFMTQISDGSIVVCRYYNLNNNGFGELYNFPVNGTGVPDAPLFQPIPPDSDPVGETPLQRVGYTRITPFTTADDFPAPCRVGDLVYPPVPCPGGNNTRVGKFTHPAAAPSNELLVVYTRGSANHNGIYVGEGLTAPYYDGGIYRMRGDGVLSRPEDLVLVKNDPLYNEMWPRAVVPYQRIYGVPYPANLPDLANDGGLDGRLPEATPLALIGTSSMISRDTRPFRGDRFYRHENFGDRNWVLQGSDAGLYTDGDIYAVRILALQPITDRSYPNNGRAFDSLFSERVRILGEIPVRKEGVIDAQGNPDTSFLTRIPADVPFTFQTLDRNGLVLNGAQTWHQVRPGEKRMDCGGCHAHSRTALDFNTTAAARPDYVVRDMALATPLLAIDGTQQPGVTTVQSNTVTVEYLRDIRPILQARCASCHTSRNGQTPAAGLDLDADDRLVDGTYPATYALLARPRSGSNPTPRSITPGGDWYWPQVTRYIRAGQSRQSLLVWKVFGRRLDGRTNADRPTETTAGNPATIPSGVNYNECDLDYTGQAMPPAASGLALTWEERMKIARWVDLGAPIDLSQYFGSSGFAAFLEDDLRPTLALVPTAAQAARAGLLTRLVIGAYDLESGLNSATLSLTFDRAVGAVPAGTNLAAGLGVANGGTVAINLPATVDLAAGAITATLRIRDLAGHTAQIVRTYRNGPAGPASFKVGGRIKTGDGVELAGVTLSFTVMLGSGQAPAAAQTDANGNWSREGFQAGTTYRVTPTLAGYTFTPASRDFSGGIGSLNFIGAATSFIASGKVIVGRGSAGGVTMSFSVVSGSGTAPAAVATDSEGRWSQTGFQTGTTYRVTPSAKGGVFNPTSRDFSSRRTDLDFKRKK
jgi:hydrazine synthase alpha subunit-like protein